ncbi:probable serine/threonine-protein kinase PBL18 isoform X1 [Zingiber officinale]|uniref:probable serine/threonine-protein kinase PBL18 isoform X1 n=2 Tax=Zingiber officinale TaxID=94328 RepID=UPI001C4B7624|nr:probable serine/threonine-protein kinase PBL18 isoform X1 [Zingiber officinale]XP_042376653.1 probable serine/threonine-protein kinase PBL18 isoform X1 [Zingiber officinale]XP_042376663.1 probable serine/threonine-protein kinase PBL18 isoform X1 [Zingiber officinale]
MRSGVRILAKPRTGWRRRWGRAYSPFVTLAMALLGLGDAANVAQLTGLDAVSLIRMIVKAASTARSHKKNCQKFAQQLKLIGNLLEQIRITELKKHPSTREPLELLEDALRRSYILVHSCHNCNYLYLLAMGWKIIKQFRTAHSEITEYLNLIPLITLVDIQRNREQTKNIKLEQCVNKSDELDKKVQDTLFNSGFLLATTNRLAIGHAFLRKFKFKELRSATMNFSNVNFLGSGGYVMVYKGLIDHSSLKGESCGSYFLKKRASKASKMTVAIQRRVYTFKHGSQQFEAKLNYRGCLLHPNVVKLLGYCKEENIIVCEFIPKGSLKDHLFQRTRFQPLPWKLRVKIAVGIARGLAYLHTAHVIHRDIKAANILLDSEFNPKLADFGLAMYGPTERQSFLSQDVCDTYGYLAPEYLADGKVNEKIDVYGFGILLLELLSGKQAYEILTIKKSSKDECETSQHFSTEECGTSKEVIEDLSTTEQQWSESVLQTTLPNYEEVADSCLLDYKTLTRLMEPDLHGQYPLKAAVLAVQLAKSCVTWDPTSRPAMQKVIETLEQIQTIDKPPVNLGSEKISDPCSSFYEVDFSVSSTVVYEPATFDADTELSFSALK